MIAVSDVLLVVLVRRSGLDSCRQEVYNYISDSKGSER